MEDREKGKEQIYLGEGKIVACSGKGVEGTLKAQGPNENFGNQI